MNEEITQKVDDLVSYIINTYEYQKCIEIKKIMSNNLELMENIEKIKQLQKKVIREKDSLIEKQLEMEIKKLNAIPIYQEYNNYLTLVNNKINYIKDFLNEYFNNKLNNDIM